MLANRETVLMLPSMKRHAEVKIVLERVAFLSPSFPSSFRSTAPPRRRSPSSFYSRSSWRSKSPAPHGKRWRGERSIVRLSRAARKHVALPRHCVDVAARRAVDRHRYAAAAITRIRVPSKSRPSRHIA